MILRFDAFFLTLPWFLAGATGMDFLWWKQLPSAKSEAVASFDAERRHPEKKP